MVQLYQSGGGRVRRWSGLTSAFFLAFTACSRVACAQERPQDSRSGRVAVATSLDPARAGAAVSYSIDSTEIMASAAPTLSQALQARLPGLSVLQSGGVAAQGAQLRSRGPHSLYMAGEPIVIVDGIRVDATQDATVLELGVSTSRLDDIAPDDVARVDLLPGAAAAALYGPGAAGGAIVITTKRGTAGPLHWSSRAQAGLATMAASFPTNYRTYGISTANGQPVPFCPLSDVAAGYCTATRMRTWNPFEQASPFRNAASGSAHISMSGGDSATTARVGLSGSRTLGLTPDDDDRRASVRANITHRIGQSFELSGNAGYLRSRSGLPVRGDNFDASNVIEVGMFGNSPDSVNGSGTPQVTSSTLEDAIHWSTSGAANWHIASWLEASAVYGRDQLAEHDNRYTAYPAPGSLVGFEHARFNHALTSINVSATSSYGLFGNALWHGQTTAGFQRLKSLLDARDSVTGGGFAGMGTNWTIGGPWLREEAAWNDRLLVGAGARWERRTVVATAIPGHWFKSGDVAWLIGRALSVDSLRLRAAYGEAGNWSAGEPSRVGTFSGFSSPNPEFLDPTERTAESEVGADFSFPNLVRVSLTAFRADASHLYVFDRPVASGFPPGATPDGKLRNEGLEVAANVLLAQADDFRWDATISASTLRDRVVATDSNFTFVTPYGMTRRGSPVSGYYGTPYTFADANGDGLIGANEIQYQFSQTGVLGSSLPTREASLFSTMSFFSSQLTISAQLDYRGGQKLSNQNEFLRCVHFVNCRQANDPTTSLAKQAQVVAANDPFLEDGTFTKLRELSARVLLPTGVARFLGGQASLTIAGRNLLTWTRYSGPDPEVNAQPLNMLPRIDLAQTPLPREVLVRLDIGGVPKS